MVKNQVVSHAQNTLEWTLHQAQDHAQLQVPSNLKKHHIIQFQLKHQKLKNDHLWWFYFEHKNVLELKI